MSSMNIVAFTLLEKISVTEKMLDGPEECVKTSRAGFKSL